MNVSAGPPALSLSTSVGRQNRACILQLHCPSVCDWPVYKQSDPWRLRCGHPTSYVSYTLSAMDCSRGVGCGINETEAQCAITNCTLRASGTVPATGMSNPQWGLCRHYFVYYVSWHGTASVDLLFIWWFCQRLAWCNLYCTARPSESISPRGILIPRLWLWLLTGWINFEVVGVVHFLAFAHAEGRMMIEMFQAMWAGIMGGGWGVDSTQSSHFQSLSNSHRLPLGLV